MRTPRRARRGSLVSAGLIVATGIGLAALAFWPLVVRPQALVDSPRVGKPAPAIAGTDLAGRSWTLADGYGRLVWINFWATNCEPCRTEMPAMQRLAEEHPDDLLILGVDWGEGRDAAAGFAARYGIRYPILLDPRLENYYRWASRDGLPRHYFIDRHGTVVREVIGPLDPATMVTILDQLLG
jgi:thiol-disulfide isomerase/thioredoxin